MNNKLEIQCSPGTFKRVEDDEEYRQAVAAQMAGMQSYDEVVFSPNATESADSQPASQETIDQDDQIIAADGRKTVWLDTSTKLLIAKVKELRPKVGKSPRLKNKKHMWVAIAKELCDYGHNFNASQVEAKYFSLERQYKNARLNNSKTGRNRQTCPYQGELDDLLRDKRSVNPEHILDSETNVTSRDSTMSESMSESLNSSQSENLDMMPSCSKKRKTVLQQYVDNAESHAEYKEASDRKLYQLLEENIEEKRKERAEKKERAERKEALENRRLACLESLVMLLSKEKE